MFMSLKKGYILLDIEQIVIVDSSDLTERELDIQQGYQNHGTEWLIEPLEESGIYKEKQTVYVVWPFYQHDYDGTVDLSFWDFYIDDYCIEMNKKLAELGELPFIHILQKNRTHIIKINLLHN